VPEAVPADRLGRVRQHPHARAVLAVAAAVALSSLLPRPAAAEDDTTTTTADDGTVLGKPLVTEEEIAAAIAQEQALTAQLTATTQRYVEANGRLLELLEEAVRLEERIRLREDALAEVRVQINLRAREIYMAGGGSALETFLGSASLNDWIIRSAFLEKATQFDAALLDSLGAQQADLEADKLALVELRGEQQGVVAELQDAAGLMDAQLAQHAELRAQLEGTRSAQLDELRRQEEARRAAEAARALNDGSGVPLSVTPGIICPVPGAVTFVNDWGFPRSGGRTHKGNDMFAAYGTALVAAMDGTILRLGSGGLGGMSVWLLDDYGNTYYYAHLSGFAAHVADGVRVRGGEIIAFVGNTGQAITTPPHLHFEIHPGDGPSVDPYPYLIAWQRGTDVALAFTAAVTARGQAPAVGAVLVGQEPPVEERGDLGDGLAQAVP